MTDNEHDPYRIRIDNQIDIQDSLTPLERKLLNRICALEKLLDAYEIGQEEVKSDLKDVDKRLTHVEDWLEAPILRDFWEGSPVYEKDSEVGRRGPFTKRKYRMPEASNRVLEAVKSIQKRKITELLPEYLETLGDPVELKQYSYGHIYDKLAELWHDHPTERNRICVDRQELMNETNLHQETLYRNTQHLKHRGEIYQFGKRGGRGRIHYSLSWRGLTGLLSVPLDAEVRRRYPQKG